MILEKNMATHSNILAWKIPRTEEEPSGLWTTGSQGVGHDWVTEHTVYDLNMFFYADWICKRKNCVFINHVFPWVKSIMNYSNDFRLNFSLLVLPHPPYPANQVIRFSWLCSEEVFTSSPHTQWNSPCRQACFCCKWLEEEKKEPIYIAKNFTRKTSSWCIWIHEIKWHCSDPIVSIRGLHLPHCHSQALHFQGQKGHQELGFILPDETVPLSQTFLFYFIFATLHGLWNLTSPTRDWTQITAVKTQNPNH